MPLEETVKIGEERLGVLIGPKGAVKKRIEKMTNTRIGVDSDDHSVTVRSASAANPMGFYSALHIVKAIGRGFSPEPALMLADADYSLEIVSIPEFAGTSENQINNKKSRVIGRDGKIRSQLEEVTDCRISVYGKTVSIIGHINDIENAKRAVEDILSGARFETVWRNQSKRRADESSTEW
jgi:ribosomal RNA assembly protein